MTPSAREPGQGEGTPVPTAIVATEEPIRLDVALIEDERVPADMVCMGTYRDGRLVARSVMTPEAWAQIEKQGFFDEPLQVVLVARVAPPGLQCQLFAMVPFPAEHSDDSEEPWAASLPAPPTRLPWTTKTIVRGIPGPSRFPWETSSATTATGYTLTACHSRPLTCSRGSSSGTRRKCSIVRWWICWGWTTRSELDV